MSKKIDMIKVTINLSQVLKPGMVLSASSLREISVNAGIPRATLFWKFFIASEMLRRLSKTEYEFIGFSSNNCMKKCLDRTYSKYYNAQKKYESKKKEKSKKPAQNPYVQAISLLQKAGYSIRDPEGNLMWEL